MISDEVEFYKQFDIPYPKLCPNCRHFERLAKRNPLQLWKRTCARCSKAIETSYAPDPRYAEGSGEASRPEIIYCDSCYKAEFL